MGTVAEEHANQLAHGEVHGVETQVNEEELVRAVEVTHSHPLAQKIQQQLILPKNEGAEGAVTSENQFSRAEREKSSEHIGGGGTSGGEELREGTGVENLGPVNDSDTGVTEAEVKD